MVMATTDDLVRADVDALLSHLVSDPSVRRGPIGCIGYCNGVRYLLRTMSQRPDLFAAGAGLHPSFCVSSDADSPHHCISSIKSELYFAFGKSDHVASVEHNRPLIDEIARLGDRASIDVIPGADHGFAVFGPNYHESAAIHSHARTISLFKRALATFA